MRHVCQIIVISALVAHFGALASAQAGGTIEVKPESTKSHTIRLHKVDGDKKPAKTEARILGLGDGDERVRILIRGDGEGDQAQGKVQIEIDGDEVDLSKILSGLKLEDMAGELKNFNIDLGDMGKALSGLNGRFSTDIETIIEDVTEEMPGIEEMIEEVFEEHDETPADAMGECDGKCKCKCHRTKVQVEKRVAGPFFGLVGPRTKHHVFHAPDQAGKRYRVRVGRDRDSGESEVHAFAFSDDDGPSKRLRLGRILKDDSKGTFFLQGGNKAKPSKANKNKGKQNEGRRDMGDLDQRIAELSKKLAALESELESLRR
ncbi:MAG: hypothetical protein KDB53_20220 [Planctomycetes bacterium]|nr:hypothetical protein [Planctomycetota bacterium]